MTRFMDVARRRVGAARPDRRRRIRRDFPQFADVEIPRRIVNSVTLSTMHGCPPDEIERIARYCLEERGLHTVVKLNPTLLGKDAVLEILHDRLGFTDDRDPRLGVRARPAVRPRRSTLITSLKAVAASRGLTFGVKLSNTLAMANHAGRLPGDEMYMSGRALYPVTMRLYDRLLHEFDGDLHVLVLGGRGRRERGRRSLVVRRAAGHRLHRPAEAGRRRADDAVAGAAAARRWRRAGAATLADLSRGPAANVARGGRRGARRTRATRSRRSRTACRR